MKNRRSPGDEVEKKIYNNNNSDDNDDDDDDDDDDDSKHYDNEKDKFTLGIGVLEF